MRNVLNILTLALIGLWITPGHATIIVKLTDKQMAQRADAVVHGRVLQVHSQWHPKDKKIYTYVKIAVVKRYKGKESLQILDIRQVGGSINSIGSYVPGRAIFRVGEEAVLFLEQQRHKKKYFHVMGMSYGKLQIVEDPKTQIRYLVRNTKGIAAGSWDKKGKFRIQHVKANKHKPILMKTFVQQLRLHLAQTQQPARPVQPRLKPPTQR